MELPNHGQAYVPRRKLTDYLLSETHSEGRAKAIFFRGHGYNEDYVDLLEEGLLAIARTESVGEVEETPYGAKYVMEGTLEPPIGSRIRVRSVWFIPNGETAPRFITAYPD